MTYKITASERTSASASEMETKAMLYLFCDDDEGKIHGFAIDFFNDVTGVDRNALHLYDIQSKGNDAGPADLGREMVTLFKNYVSEFKDYFVERILFVRRIRRSSSIIKILQNSNMQIWTNPPNKNYAKA